MKRLGYGSQAFGEFRGSCWIWSLLLYIQKPKKKWNMFLVHGVPKRSQAQSSRELELPFYDAAVSDIKIFSVGSLGKALGVWSESR